MCLVPKCICSLKFSAHENKPALYVDATLSFENATSLLQQYSGVRREQGEYEVGKGPVSLLLQSAS